MLVFLGESVFIHVFPPPDIGSHIACPVSTALALLCDGVAGSGFGCVNSSHQPGDMVARWPSTCPASAAGIRSPLGPFPKPGLSYNGPVAQPQECPKTKGCPSILKFPARSFTLVLILLLPCPYPSFLAPDRHRKMSQDSNGR